MSCRLNCFWWYIRAKHASACVYNHIWWILRADDLTLTWNSTIRNKHAWVDIWLSTTNQIAKNHPINQTQTQTPNNHQPTPTKPSASSTANSQISSLSHSHIRSGGVWWCSRMGWGGGWRGKVLCCGVLWSVVGSYGVRRTLRADLSHFKPQTTNCPLCQQRWTDRSPPCLSPHIIGTDLKAPLGPSSSWTLSLRNSQSDLFVSRHLNNDTRRTSQPVQTADRIKWFQERNVDPPHRLHRHQEGAYLLPKSWARSVGGLLADSEANKRANFEKRVWSQPIAVCTHTRAHTCTHTRAVIKSSFTRTRTRTHTRAHTHTHAHACTHTHARTLTHSRTHAHTHTHTHERTPMESYSFAAR